MPARFPSVKARVLLAALRREPLAYRVVRQEGSHRTLQAEGRPDLHFAFHDGATVGGSLVRRILVKDVGLTEDEAREVLS